MDYFYATGQKDAARELVEQFHYSHHLPSNIQFIFTAHEPGGLFGDFGRPIAMVLFTIPSSRWTEEVWELARLVRRDDSDIKLTGLIARACKFIRRKGDMDLLVSFADSTHNHHGGIYQASSWNYHCQRDKRVDGMVIDGTLVPARVCNHRYGTSSVGKLREILRDHTVEPHWDMGKHLYWRALRKSGELKADRLGLTKSAYPKPGRANQ
jgi:hypothetical protein